VVCVLASQVLAYLDCESEVKIMEWFSELVYVSGDPVLTAVNMICILMVLELFAVICGYLGGMR
jgi:hypothetical protein